MDKVFTQAPPFPDFGGIDLASYYQLEPNDKCLCPMCISQLFVGTDISNKTLTIDDLFKTTK